MCCRNFLILGAALLGVVNGYAFRECTQAAGLVERSNFTTTGGEYVGNLCFVKASGLEYAVKIKELGICKTKPVAPTSAGAYILGSDCVALFQNPSGAAILVPDPGAAIPTTLTVTGNSISNGAYSFGYVIVDSSFTAKGKIHFDGNVTGDNVLGSWCATKTASVAESGDYEDSATTLSCSVTEPASAGVVTAKFDWITDTGNGNYIQLNSVMDAGTAGDIYLLNASHKVATTAASVDGLFGVGTFSSPITVSDGGGQYDVAFKKSLGMAVVMDWTALNAGTPSFKLASLSPGAFSFKITKK